MTSHLARALLALGLLLGAARGASAQDCPSYSPTGALTDSRSQTLEGRLIYHDGIRQWFELKLDRATCGQRSIQLTRRQGSWKPLESLRGCRVRSTGAIGLSGTGYYSRDLNQAVTSMTPLGACVAKRALPDHSDAVPDRHIRAYRVDMDVDYRPGDHPIIFHVRSGNRDLRPWQAYASYMLTGSYVLYGMCGRGFVVDKVYGTPAARPSHFDDPRTSSDRAEFDPESAAGAGKTDLRLGYSCVRAGSD